VAKAALNLMAALLTACTTPIVRDTSAIDARTAQCETPDCVIALMDTLPQGPDSARYAFVEGHPDPKLRTLKEQGKLDIDILNPLWIGAFVFGYAVVNTYPYGGISSCTVRYLPGFNWSLLKHELAHCQGYKDHGINLFGAPYTDAQKAIMTKEQVSTWTETSIHRSGGDRP
jgi:hypothetical protein